MRRLLFAVVVLIASPAWAQTAQDAYDGGAFIRAASLAVGGGAPDDLALASRALLAEAVTGDPENLDVLLDRAERYARRALAADAGNVDARLQLAVALGMKGRRATIAEALKRNYAREGRTLLQTAIAAAPEEAWAHALLGGWHLEIVRRGGAMGAAYFGASASAGRASFERARRLDPDDPVIAYQYAVALLELDARRHGGEAARLLDIAGACRASDAFEAHVKQQARRVAVVLRTDGAGAAISTATGAFTEDETAAAIKP